MKNLRFLLKIPIFLVFYKQKRHIKRQGQNLPTAAYVVIAEFERMINMIMV